MARLILIFIIISAHLGGIFLQEKTEIWTIAGQRVVDFCRGFPTYLIHDLKTNDQNSIFEDTLNENIASRKKRSTKHYFVGRVRGQTQSQYLNFGNSKDLGKAEAESSYGSSKAVVSGSSGMGQAQSQSVPVGCEECNGEGFDQEQGLYYGRPGGTSEFPGAQYRKPEKPGTSFSTETQERPGVLRYPGGAEQRPGVSKYPEGPEHRPGVFPYPGRFDERLGYPGGAERTPAVPGYPKITEVKPGFPKVPEGLPGGTGYPGGPGKIPGVSGVSGYPKGPERSPRIPGYPEVRPGISRYPTSPEEEPTGAQPGVSGYPGKFEERPGISIYPQPGVSGYPGGVPLIQEPVRPGYPGGVIPFQPGYRGEVIPPGGVFSKHPEGETSGYIGPPTGSKVPVYSPYPGSPRYPTGPSRPSYPATGQPIDSLRPGYLERPAYSEYSSTTGYPSQPGYPSETPSHPVPGTVGYPTLPQLPPSETHGKFSGKLSGDYEAEVGQRGKFSGIFSGEYEAHHNGKIVDGRYYPSQPTVSRYPGYPGYPSQTGYPGPATYPGTSDGGIPGYPGEPSFPGYPSPKYPIPPSGTSYTEKPTLSGVPGYSGAPKPGYPGGPTTVQRLEVPHGPTAGYPSPSVPSYLEVPSPGYPGVPTGTGSLSYPRAPTSGYPGISTPDHSGVTTGLGVSSYPGTPSTDYNGVSYPGVPSSAYPGIPPGSGVSRYPEAPPSSVPFVPASPGYPGVPIPAGYPGALTPGAPSSAQPSYPTGYPGAPAPPPSPEAYGQPGYPGVVLGEDDGADSQVQTSVQQINNETQASASAQGKYAGGMAQSQVSGTYSGSGSFSASAGSDDGKKGALSQVSGGKEGALSSAQGRGGLGQSQAQVQLASESGDTISNAQTGGWHHGSQTQVQASGKGGMADAQANGPGSTSSQAQIGFTPYDENERDDQSTPFRGGGMASAQSGTYAGQAQSQIQGKFQYGIKYVGAAQAGSGSKDSVGLSRNQSRPEGLTGFFPKFKPLNFTSGRNSKTKPQDLVMPSSRKSIHMDVATQKAPSEDQTALISDETEDTATEEYHDDDYDYDSEYSTQKPLTKSIISQGFKTQRQHIILDPLEDLDATVQQSYGYPPDGTIFQPGDSIPGSPGFQIPAGFRGRVKAIANGPNTYATGKNSQAQSVTLTPGTGRIIYKKPIYAVTSNSHQNGYIGFGSGYTYQPATYQVKSGKSLPNFISLSKSESGSKNPYTGQKTPKVYYAQSSSCGVFTNTCVFNGSEKLCFPKPKTNPDGSYMTC
ncbi:collagen alpha-1(III) chain-like isoform X2 [Tribolium madens]|uniref:collagen alpha-1(III) chain-like isoform X2 n=1 Tax=Tribolium madens TaxID=41895 RepID=UPI001CF740C1|nr:collagen alpha-1(III) chain-like isoform X2 [Tribolium madens]